MNRYSKKKKSNPVAVCRVTRSAGTVLVTLLVVLFMMIAGVLPALADGKIYPGSMGVRTGGTSTPCYDHSAIGNPSNDSWLLLDLPVIHDSIPGHILRGWVRVIDQHHDSNVCCSLNSFYRNGCSWVGWWTQRCSSGWGCHAQHIPFGGIGANNISHYYYTCKIPPRDNGNISYITSYFVDE